MYIENNPENSTLLVEAITVDPSSVTLPEMHKKTLSATVYPESVLNKEVEWSSSDTSIATVNSATGEVCAKKEGGPVTIYATACDGSGVYGTCQVTVGPPIPVQGVHILQENLSMYSGETKCLDAIIYPGDASNKAVMWCSSDPSVASVGLYTGEVWAVGPGTATITVTTLDGGFTSSITVTVYIDEVIVRKEESERYGHHTAVEFKSTGKIWRCVFADLVHSGDASTTETNRAKENFYEGYPNNTVEVKHYSDDELKLLYAIDPHGVADYVKSYAEKFGREYYGVEYKDRVFKLLFGRDPDYYEYFTGGRWYITYERENLDHVLSESELLFGAHEIRDGYESMYVVNAVVELAIDIASLVFGPAVSVTEMALKAFVSAYAKSLVDKDHSPFDLLVDDSISFAADTAFEAYIEEFVSKNDANWLSNVTGIPGLITGFIENISSSILTVELSFVNGMIDYCLRDVGYDVILQEGADSLSLDDARNRLNDAVEN